MPGKARSETACVLAQPVHSLPGGAENYGSQDAGWHLSPVLVCHALRRCWVISTLVEG